MIELMDAESLQASYVLAIQYLSYRQRSAYEIEQYLLKKEVEPKHIELVMDRLNNEKLLDDLEFAKTFVQERIRQKKKGPKIISNELFQKGISKEKIDKAISIMTFDEQYQIALDSGQKERIVLKKNRFKNKKTKYELI